MRKTRGPVLKKPWNMDCVIGGTGDAFLRYLYYLHHFFNPRLAETTRAADGAPCRVSGEWCRNWHNIIHLLPSNSEERLILLDQGDENDNDGD